MVGLLDYDKSQELVLKIIQETDAKDFDNYDKIIYIASRAYACGVEKIMSLIKEGDVKL